MAADIHDAQTALGDVAARTLANATKTRPMMGTITPRWLPHLLNWVPVEAGIYRVNKVKDASKVIVDCSHRDERELPATYVDYEEWGREYMLSAVNTVLDVHSRVADLYSSPFDQTGEQLRLIVETIKERQEGELINNKEYGLLNNVAKDQRVKTRTGAPTPDDLDELLTKVWKEPGFFLAHPKAIAAFGRECTRRGVPPPTVSLFGSQFLTWRGVPLIPCDKVGIDKNNKTSIILLRTGESRQGVVGLYQPGLQGEQSPGLSVRFMGINHKAIASYLVSLYCSLAVLTDDALAVLEDVQVDIAALGLPEEATLQQLANRLFRTAPAGSTLADPEAVTSSYYFLDHARVEPAGLSVPSVHGVAPQLPAALPRAPFDVELVRRDFPILQERVNGRPLVWFDNAATTQKPQSVIDRVAYFYQHENSNIHRAAHELAARATDAYEEAREKVRVFLNAASANEIVFVRGATEAINLVAQSWGRQHIQAGDEIVVSHLEHHANIVPWKHLADEKGAVLKVIPVDDNGQILLDEYANLLGPKTKIVSFTQVSNALGTVTPAQQMVAMAHAAGAKVLVDGAQSVSHMKVDVQALDADWFVFSGHKVFGPTGIGVAYGKEDLLNATQPWQGGGNMIEDVTFERIRYQPAPNKFEAGTGNIADAVGLGAALDYVSKLGMDNIAAYEHYLLEYATRLMEEVPGLRMIGTAPDKASVLSFVLEGYKTEEVGKALNQEGVAVRSGHHCAQPILRRFGLEATVRPSLAFYNTCGEVDTLVGVLHRLRSARPLRVS
jgi:cysteine desulfurase/selenocysteine lyase